MARMGIGSLLMDRKLKQKVILKNLEVLGLWLRLRISIVSAKGIHMSLASISKVNVHFDKFDLLHLARTRALSNCQSYWPGLGACQGFKHTVTCSPQKASV